MRSDTYGMDPFLGRLFGSRSWNYLCQVLQFSKQLLQQAKCKIIIPIFQILREFRVPYSEIFFQPENLPVKDYAQEFGVSYSETFHAAKLFVKGDAKACALLSTMWG
jgi:hypothetical protein